MGSVEFPSLEAEVAFLRGLNAVVRMSDDILEDCLERGLSLDAAVDVFLTQCARLVHASAGFVSLRGTAGPVLTRVLGQLGLTELVTSGGFAGTRTSLYPKDGRFADYMLVSPGVSVTRFEVVREPEVSDHCALLLDIA